MTTQTLQVAKADSCPTSYALREVNKDSIAIAGGKGANLGEMIQAGMPVPPGFVVTAQIYRAHLAASQLAEPIAKRLQGLRTDDLATMAAASQEITTWIGEAAVPEHIRQDILRAYADLCAQISGDAKHALDCPVAVRSSATAEDLPSASFAGQQETFLNICGPEAVLQAIRSCWASLWNTQAIAYRAELGYDHLQVDLAVVVQAMVPAEVAGVMFTANPVNGNRDEILISASYGLGESVVSGTVTPDTFVITKAGTIRQRHLGMKETQVVPAGATTRHEAVAALDRQRFCLSDADLKALAELASRVQDHYGSPQDTEWALVQGKLYLLQARPITTLMEPLNAQENALDSDLAQGLPVLGEAPLSPKLFMVDAMLEYWPEPPTPLDISFLCAVSDGFGLVFQDLGLRKPAQSPQPVERSDGRIALRMGNPRLSPAMIWKFPTGIFSRFRGDPLVKWQVVDEEMIARQQYWQKAAQTAQGSTSLAALIELELKEYSHLFFRRFSAISLGGDHATLLMKWFSRWVAGREGATQLGERLLRAAPFRTAQQNEALQQLAQLALTQGKESAPFQAAWAAFMAEWGIRPSRGLVPTPSTMTWQEDPSPVMDLVDALVSDASSRLPDQATNQEAADYQAAKSEVEARLWAPLRGLFRNSLDHERSNLIVREDSHYRLEAVIATIRDTALRLGESLARDQVIDTAGDVFFLLASELAPTAKEEKPVREQIARRKQAYARLIAAHKQGIHWLVATGTIPPTAVVSAHKPQASAEKDGKIRISGLAASRGEADGPVCVVHGPDEFGKLRKGDVLVATFTSPVWTPLFRLASAVVTDTGSPNSHAAIVAREYGVPTVVATINATRQLKDGQRVHVDGTQGLVTVIDPQTNP